MRLIDKINWVVERIDDADNLRCNGVQETPNTFPLALTIASSGLLYHQALESTSVRQYTMSVI